MRELERNRRSAPARRVTPGLIATSVRFKRTDHNQRAAGYRSSVLGVPVKGRTTWRLCCLLATLAAAGCGDRFPFYVSRERHPEYYAGMADQPPPRVETRSRARAPKRREDERRPRPVSREFVPPQLGDLPGEIQEVAPASGDGAGERFDLAGGRASGAVLVEVNDPVLRERLDVLFDGATAEPVRSDGVNPLVFRIALDPPVRLVGVRVFPSYSTYDWTVRANPEQPRLLVRGAAEEQWSSIELPEPLVTGEVQIEIARLVRDDFVHVNEIELMVEP
jgi:hypothetical protein